MSIKSGKLWGETTEILNILGIFQLHFVKAYEGHVCSEHHHKFRLNWFYVFSGSLLIRRWKENGVVDETILNAGEQTQVPPEEFHQFEVLENCSFLEAYWPYIPGQDIIRRTQGGKIK